MIPRIEPMPRTATGPVAMLHRACFPEEPWEAEALEQLMRIRGFFGQIGWIDDDPAGYVLALDLGNEFEILSLGVVADRRRTGVGSALLDSICFEATRRGASGVVLEVAADNNAARALYKGRGFTVVGCRRNYYQRGGHSVDAFILRAAMVADRCPT